MRRSESIFPWIRANSSSSQRPNRWSRSLWTPLNRRDLSNPNCCRNASSAVWFMLFPSRLATSLNLAASWGSSPRRVMLFRTSARARSLLYVQSINDSSLISLYEITRRRSSMFRLPPSKQRTDIAGQAAALIILSSPRRSRDQSATIYSFRNNPTSQTGASSRLWLRVNLDMPALIPALGETWKSIWDPKDRYSRSLRG